MKMQKVALLFIILIAFILRFYKLGSIPDGLNQDESSIGYNAYSILKTGKDEYGVSHPIVFKAFGEYKLPAYIYIATIPINIFGNTPFAVRLPSALSGLLTVMIFYALIKMLSKNIPLTLVSTFLLAINPWHIHYSRAAFEANLALFFITLGTGFLVYSLSYKRLGMFTIATTSFIASMYTYNIARIFSPLLYVVILRIFIKQKKPYISKLEIYSTMIVSIIFLMPFIYSILAHGGFDSTTGTLIPTSNAIKAPLLEFRSYVILKSQILGTLFLNLPFQETLTYLQHIASYLSIQFYFISGSQHGNHGIGNIGQFYLFELIFMIYGVYMLSKQRSTLIHICIAWIALCVCVAAFTREAPHATRSLFLVIPMTFISGYGAIHMYMHMKKFRFSTYAFLGITLLCFMIFTLSYYLLSYFIRFPIYYAKSWNQADASLMLYIKQNEHKYAKVVFDNKASVMYSSLAYYNAISPSEFQETAKRTPDDTEGFNKVLSFGKYEFKDMDWQRDYAQKNTLIITTPDNKPEYANPLLTIYYPKKPVVFSSKEVLYIYPIQEIAYVLVETKSK